MRPSASRALRFYAIPLLAVLALVLIRVALPIRRSFDARAMEAVPADVRARLFDVSLAEVRSTCLQGHAARGPLRAHCVAQARFVELLPECGPECRAAAAVVLRSRLR